MAINWECSLWDMKFQGGGCSKCSALFPPPPPSILLSQVNTPYIYDHFTAVEVGCTNAYLANVKQRRSSHVDTCVNLLHYAHQTAALTPVEHMFYIAMFWGVKGVNWHLLGAVKWHLLTQRRSTYVDACVNLLHYAYQTAVLTPIEHAECDVGFWLREH